MPELAADAEAEIRRHGTETYPNECCGALIASGGDDRRGFRLPNTTAEGPRRRFLIGPNDYRPRRGPRPGARRDARRLLSFASRSSGPAVGNGSGAGMAESDIHNRCGPRRPARKICASGGLREDRSGFEEI
jgi:hypothetical protein